MCLLYMMKQFFILIMIANLDRLKIKEKTILIFKAIHLNTIAIFIFDNFSFYNIFTTNILNTKTININFKNK